VAASRSSGASPKLSASSRHSSAFTCGLLGEAYIHGMNSIAEGVRQVRGTSVNQAREVEHVLVSCAMAGAILGRV